MNPLVFRTAVPFGYLGFALLLLVALTAGIALVLRGRRGRRSGQAAAGGALVLFAIVVGGVSIAEEEALDLNPVFETPALLGTWRDGRATLELRADGGYRCAGRGACAALGAAGTWERLADFEIALRRSPAGATTVHRVVSYRGELRLTEQSGDPDTWDGRLTFKRLRPAS